VTEPSVASGVGCLNLASRQWDTDILNALNISPALFPSVVESTDRWKAEIRNSSPCGTACWITYGRGGSDSAAAAISLSISSSNLNRGSLGIGTSGVILTYAHPIPRSRGRVHLFSHVDGGYYLLGVTLAAGGSLRWYRDTFAPNHSYTELMDMANRSLLGASGVLFYPTYQVHTSIQILVVLGLICLWRIRSRADSCCTRGRCIQPAGSVVISEITPVHQLWATGGGALQRWLRILADVLQTELITPKAEEGAALTAIWQWWGWCVPK